MSTVTPNFNWPVPTSTDLVKDGATAIEALGDSIDASLVDLKGGTTGQILSKATNADMDFTWIANDQGDITGVTAGTGISGGGTSGTVTVTNSMATTITTKGDLVPGTGSGTFARLAAGSNGETLVADSSTSTGLRYTAGNPIPNPVLNSAFNVWQRGTTASNPSSIATTYIADRWNFYRAAGFTTGITMSRQATGDTTNLPFIQYCSRIQRTAANTSTVSMYLVQNFESINSIAYAGKTVTLSFYARAGANYSATSSILNAQIVTGTGTDQNVINGYTGQSTALTVNSTLTTTWQRFSVTGSIGSSVTQIAPLFQFDPTGTAGANDYFEVTGVQIDIGSVALPFRTNGATFQGELAACQRYFNQNTMESGHTGEVTLAVGSQSNTTNSNICYQFPVQMRVEPTVTMTGLQMSDQAGFSTAATLSSTSGCVQSVLIRTTMSANGAQYRPIFLIFPNAFTTAYLRLDAEL